ncbi:hypothetical protein MKEN_00213600 [Mycena kentingensis (nom. inval.)]|nr:hypothetical protein MKEN_00213600 [Mycena kentingensis (nom. inval.)]
MSSILCSKCQESAFKPSPLLSFANEAAHLTFLLRSNMPPPDTRSVADAKVDEGLIRRIESVLSGLRTERRRLWDHLERIYSVHHSPIRMVPNELEIIAEIMYYALLTPSLGIVDQHVDTRRLLASWSAMEHPLIILSEVCYQWHTVLLVPRRFGRTSQRRRPFSLHIIRVGIPRRDSFEDPAFWERCRTGWTPARWL